MKTKSRSGHTALLAPSLRPGPRLWGLFVFGGRDEGGEEVHKCGQVVNVIILTQLESHLKKYISAFDIFSNDCLSSIIMRSGLMRKCKAVSLSQKVLENG